MIGVPGRRDGSEILPHGLYDPAAPHPEPSTDAHSPIQQQPDGGGSGGHDRATLIDQPQSHQGSYRIAERKDTKISVFSLGRHEN